VPTSVETLLAMPTITLSNAAPFRIDLKLGKLSGGCYEVIKPLPVSVVYESDSYVAEVVGADVSVSESTCSEAVQALKEFVEHLCERRDAGAALGAGMRQTMSILEQHIAKRKQHPAKASEGYREKT